MHGSGSLRRVLIGIWSTCAVATFGPVIWRAANIHPNLFPPLIPAVVLPEETRMATDQVSSVGHLVWVIAFAIACCIPLELAKYYARGWKMYVSLVAMQLLLVLDLLRAAAWDWWLYLLLVLRLFEFDPQGSSPWWLIVRGAWPWATTAYALIFTITVTIVERRAMRPL